MQQSLRSYVRAFLSAPVIWLALAPLAATASEATGRIVGHVLDPDGQPVAGATILVDGPLAAPRVYRSDAQGAFEVATARAGIFRVRGTAPGLAAPPVEVQVTEGGTVSIDLHLRLAALEERLVVTAAQVDQPASTLPDSTTVLSGETIDTRQQFSASQVLRSVPGLTVQQSGGPGSLTSLFLRGGESDYTLVLIDGVRANGFGGGLDLSQVPLADVDRIEVVRGPQSALYGADAIGGVVHIITRTAGTPSAQGLLEAGSRAMRRGTASTTGEVRRWRWQAGGDHFQEDGYSGTASNGEPVDNDDARTSQGTASLGWRAGSGADLQGSFRYVDTDRGTPGPFGSDPAGRFAGVERTARNLTTRRSGSLRWLQPWSGASSTVRQRTEFDMSDYDLTSRSSFPSEGETRRMHVRSQTDLSAAASLGLTGGVEWLDERGSSTFITAGADGPVPVERSVVGVFGEARWQAADRLSLTAGVRGERIHRDAFPGDPSAFTPRPDFPADTIVSLNPKLAGAWLVKGDPTATRAWTRLHGAAGTGIRPPDAFEVAFTDNPGLSPERSRSAEVGVAQAWLSGALQLDATGFVNDYDDLIIAVGRTFSGVSRWRTDNISNARARGLEASAAWRPEVAVALQATYTFLSTEILAVDGSSAAPPPYVVGDPLLRRPRHQGTFDATWNVARGSAFLQVLVRGETRDAEPAFGPTGGLYTNPGYTVANLGTSFEIARGVSVHGRVLNAFDTHYEEVLGYPAPGRTFYAGVRLAASR